MHECPIIPAPLAERESQPPFKAASSSGFNIMGEEGSETSVPLTQTSLSTTLPLSLWPWLWSRYQGQAQRVSSFEKSLHFFYSICFPMCFFLIFTGSLKVLQSVFWLYAPLSPNFCQVHTLPYPTNFASAFSFSPQRLVCVTPILLTVWSSPEPGLTLLKKANSSSS